MAHSKFHFKNKMLAATPLICVFAFLLIGFVWGKWHPGWMVFLLIPLMPYLVGKKKLRFSVPLVITIIYLIIGFGWNLWHPGWVIFILIPVFEIFLGTHSNDDDEKEDQEFIEIDETKE